MVIVGAPPVVMLTTQFERCFHLQERRESLWRLIGASVGGIARVLKAAKAMDVLGNQEARIWIHMVKALVPARVCEIIDQAMQMHGALGLSQKTPLASMYAYARTLRIADGPDEVHHMVVGRNEVGQHRQMPADQSLAAVFRN